MRFTFAATFVALASSVVAAPLDSQAARYAGLARAETLATRACSTIPGKPDPNMMKRIYRTVRQRSTDDNIMIITFITAWQESHINNLNCGDRQSFGLFQQQSMYGWGDHDCITNPECSTNSFLNTLLKVYPGGRSQGKTLGQIAQDVQRAIAGELYQQHVGYAKELIAQTKQMLGDSGSDNSGSGSDDDDKPTTTKTSTGGNGGAINVGGKPTPAPSKPTKPTDTKTEDGPKETPPADDGKTDGGNTGIECTQHYIPVPGDICYSVSGRFGLKLEEFYAMNPDIDEECQNLYAGTEYCVSTDPAKAASNN